ncbi:DNA-directed RNA polymerase subunit omega [Bacillus sp. 491mf]|uniref:DNA-directed RNA polymerase subunit omega n=1 Tax=Bacillus TaxID=1386 RepID=UPI00054F1CFC|nr:MULTISPECIES: DNA-directed RNA polymerase subunit omega [unclassified Bacillus (in: firmicutes)]SFB95898.1 DNA-directed RNA polymerase subunit omega [Bacillus sp. 491mf]
MLNPSIDALLQKIDSKYTLVTVAAKRAREMQEHNDCAVEKPVSHKFVGKSLEEIHAQLLSYEPSEDNNQK